MMFFIFWDLLIGGMFLGILVILMLFMNGKIAGISGILMGLLMFKLWDFVWWLLFVVGMIFGGVIGVKFLGYDVVIDFGVSGIVFVMVGLLVGVGIWLVNGCISGYGICGIGCFFKWFIVVICVFMVVVVVMVFVCFYLM